MNGRRDFLRSLAALPLIGGSVALIGQPSAVAEPITTQLLSEYAAWLGFEDDRISYELHGNHYRDAMRCRFFQGPAYRHQRGTYRPHTDDLFGFHSAPASSRAALVLSTVGCDWRSEGC